jgi:hypothetical protein
MAKVVYCNNSNLCKNNYYYALATEFVPNPPLPYQLITQALPIPAPMGTTLHPMPQLPTITPRLITLKSAWPTVAPNAWWPAQLLHWQPLFCQQLHQDMSCPTSPIPSLAWARFQTKIAQSSLHKQKSQSTNQMAIPSSQAGRMRLVCVSGTFLSLPRPLTPGMQLLPQLLCRPSQLLLQFLCHHPVSRDCPHPSPVVIPPAMSAATHPHPRQGILANSTSGVACLVYYLYGAAQALAAHAVGTPFDPCSLNLPIIGALVGFYHACLGFPVKQTLLNAIKAGNCDTFNGLTYSNAARYCPDADKTITGHLA